MAGFWHLSHHQMRDPNGAVYAGARATFYAADSLLPITVYQDYGLGTAHPNPVEANAYGIFPPVFLDEEDGFYRQRITTTDGVIIPGTDVGTLPIIGPGEGGGGSEVPVDPNALWQTGDLKPRYGTGAHAGWVRANGRTIGAAVSGAVERANADCELLFGYLWGVDSTLAVSGGRGVSSAADWAANKTIVLPDWRGYALAALDDMGNSAAGRLTAGYFGTAATVLGAVGGLESHTLTTAQLAAHSHGVTQTPHSHNIPVGNRSISTIDKTSPYSDGSGSDEVTSPANANISIDNAGGGGAHNNVQPTKLATIYMKL